MSTSYRRRPVLLGVPTSVLLFSLMLLTITTPAYAVDITAASCSQGAVQNAINAAANGDRVIVPAGTCVWSTTVNINNKAITLTGAGIDVTTIVSNISNANTLAIATPSSGVVRVTDFTFNANGVAKTCYCAEITVGNSFPGVDKFRIDHNKFTNPETRIIIIFMGGEEMSGVIDHNTFIKTTSSSVQAIAVDGGGPENRTPFSRPLSLGTNKAIYVETNTFTYSSENDGVQDSYNGARYVFRHNTIDGSTIGHHGADSGDGAGMAGFEVYGNTFTSSGPASISRIMFWRAGVGVVFDNTATGLFSGGISSKLYRSCASFRYWGQCDGSSPWDQNLPGQQGSACVDSLGHQFTQNQGGSNTLEGYYSWNNFKNGSPADTFIEKDCAAAAVHTQLNREVYNQVSPFTGASGIGRGLLSVRPTTCTVMVGYFATDTNTLYRCTSTNTWTSFYTPFTYPHPLTSGGGGGPVPPTAPSGLRTQ